MLTFVMKGMNQPIRVVQPLFLMHIDQHEYYPFRNPVSWKSSTFINMLLLDFMSLFLYVGLYFQICLDEIHLYDFENRHYYYFFFNAHR